MAKIGRPSKFSPALGEAICERIADGESLRRICKDDDLPCIDTVRKWLREGSKATDKSDPYAVFLAQYARAREEQADTYADKISDLADLAVGCGDRTTIEGVRVAIDALKWSACKLKPKVYGDKIAQEHSGPDGGPVQINLIRGTPPKGKGDEC